MTDSPSGDWSAADTGVDLASGACGSFGRSRSRSTEDLLGRLLLAGMWEIRITSPD
jgi:hypothetical protein